MSTIQYYDAQGNPLSDERAALVQSFYNDMMPGAGATYYLPLPGILDQYGGYQQVYTSPPVGTRTLDQRLSDLAQNPSEISGSGVSYNDIRNSPYYDKIVSGLVKYNNQGWDAGQWAANKGNPTGNTQYGMVGDLTQLQQWQDQAVANGWDKASGYKTPEQLMVESFLSGNAQAAGFSPGIGPYTGDQAFMNYLGGLYAPYAKGHNLSGVTPTALATESSGLADYKNQQASHDGGFLSDIAPILAIGGLALGGAGALGLLGDSLAGTGGALGLGSGTGVAGLGTGTAVGGLGLGTAATNAGLGSFLTSGLTGGALSAGALGAGALTGGGSMDALSNITNLLNPSSSPTGLWGSNMNIGDIGNYLGDQVSSGALTEQQAMQAMQAYNNAASGGTWNAFLADQPLTGIGESTSFLDSLSNIPNGITNILKSALGGSGTGILGGSGTGIGGLLSGLGGGLGGLANLAGSTVPGMMALKYAQSQNPIDTSGIQNILNQAQSNAPGFVNAAISPLQQNIAAGYGDLIQSQAQRGIRGSSFGDTDIANYIATTGQALSNAGATAQEQALGLQGNLAGQIANLNAQNQLMKNNLYGTAFNVLGRGMNPLSYQGGLNLS